MARQKMITEAILATARQIVESYDTPVTLRQLYYQLVARQLIPNQERWYKALSRATTEARRAEEDPFPDLADRIRQIYEYQAFDSPAQATRWLRRIYRRYRTEGQEYGIWIGVEKAGIVNQLQAWFGDLGLPILALGGYDNPSYQKRVIESVEDDGRPAILLYAGDHDPSGHDIDRNFVRWTDCWAKVHRVALGPDQVQAFNLPEAPGKDTDSRAKGFTERFGELVQVELDALDPNDLRAAYQDTLDQYWDADAYEEALLQEAADKSTLGEVAEELGDE